GQLGDGTTIDRLTPVRVAFGLADVVAVSAGGVHTLALKRDGTVWAWGANWSGKLGNDEGDQSSPVQVPGVSGIAAISASAHSFGLKTDGSALAWGPNAFGELGDGTLVDRTRAVVVLGEEG